MRHTLDGIANTGNILNVKEGLTTCLTPIRQTVMATGVVNVRTAGRGWAAMAAVLGGKRVSKCSVYTSIVRNHLSSCVPGPLESIEPCCAPAVTSANALCDIISALETPIWNIHLSYAISALL